MITPRRGSERDGPQEGGGECDAEKPFACPPTASGSQWSGAISIYAGTRILVIKKEEAAYNTNEAHAHPFVRRMFRSHKVMYDLPRCRMHDGHKLYGEQETADRLHGVPNFVLKQGLCAVSVCPVLPGRV